ncbi:hypothetical protein [Embleya sp. NPDC005971]|uniref:hypothetical protein n=1 Tax=unclassified Embleya TaxID=2699296 RepID=UPI0033F8664B
MTIFGYILLGAAGGAVIELVAFFNRLGEWQTARQAALKKKRRDPPSFMNFIDVRPVIAIAVTRLMLGAAGATLYGATGQATGALGALTVGAAAPAMLQQFGQIPRLREAVTDARAEVPRPVPRTAFDDKAPAAQDDPVHDGIS